MILTQKETMLLQDLKTQEQVCIEKYNQYAERANDPKLSQLLRTISSAEQQHLSTLEQMEKGTVPAMGGGQKQPFQPPDECRTGFRHRCIARHKSSALLPI